MPRYNHAAVVADGKIWVFGGYYPGYLDSIEMFDPAVGNWTLLDTKLPTNMVVVLLESESAAVRICPHTHQQC